MISLGGTPLAGCGLGAADPGQWSHGRKGRRSSREVWQGGMRCDSLGRGTWLAECTGYAKVVGGAPCGWSGYLAWAVQSAQSMPTRVSSAGSGGFGGDVGGLDVALCNDRAKKKKDRQHTTSNKRNYLLQKVNKKTT